MRKKPGPRGTVEHFMATRGQAVTVYNDWNTPRSSSFEASSYKSSKPDSGRNHFVFLEEFDVKQGSVLQITGANDLWRVTEVEDCVIRGEYIKFEAFVEKMPAQGTIVTMSTEQQLVRTLAALHQVGGSKFTNDSEVVEKLGCDLQEVQDYMDILAERRWTQAANTFGGRCAALTALGRTILRDPEYANQNTSSTVINVTGNQGVIINANSILKDVTQTIDSSSHFASESKDNLKSLVEQLEKALNEVPVEHAEDVEAVAEMAKSLVGKLDKDSPNKALMKISAASLKQAAQNLAAVAPSVITIAAQIIAVAGH